jgi:hypothetical protein
MKSSILAILLFMSCHTNGQIILPHYKCHYYEDQWPNTMSDMYNGNDTFNFTLYSKDIWGAEGDSKQDPGSELKIGLKLCFEDDGLHYYKTKDSLYLSTGQYASHTYYYEIYIPEKTVSVSVRSNKNDSDFTDKSKWLLSQVRHCRAEKKDIYFLNEKRQSCQDPNAE